MSDMKCPFCNGELYGCIGHPYCRNEKCEMCDEMMPQELLDLLDRTRKELEQSEICCTEWEKQALDYKAENIALSGDLERTRKALDVAVDALNAVTATPLNSRVIHDVANKALEQITALEQKD